MQRARFRLVTPPQIPVETETGWPSREGYRPPFEDLWWEAGPAVLSALDSVGDRVPAQIGLRLRDWLARALSENPVPALDLAAPRRSRICQTSASPATPTAFPRGRDRNYPPQGA
jgi:hypothetical protein